MTNWKETTLAEIGRVVTGKTPPTSDVSFYGGVYPFITPTDIKDDANYCTTDRYLSDGGKNLQKSILLPKNAVCYTCIASIGKICLTQKESFTNQQINSVIVDENKAHYKFIFYLLQYLTPQIKKMAGGTITGIINKGQFENFPFEIPDSIEEQKEIAGVLGSLDDKIELLREENKTLEAIAQAIFKEWFMNFNFPNAEGKPHKSSGGKMIDSELGEIPEGWRVGKYQDVVDVVTGKGIRKEDLKSQGLFQVLGANGEIGKTDKFLFDEDLILTGRVGTLGTIYISKEKVWISDNVLISKPKIIENFYFAYFHLKSFNFEGLNRGSTQPLITQTDLKNVDIVLPISETIKKWHSVSSDLFSKIYNNNSQIQTLSILRDTILPKLMSGEIKY